MGVISDIFGLINIILVYPWLIIVLLLIIVVWIIYKKNTIHKENKSKQYFIISGKLFDFIQNIFQRQLGDVLLFENRDDAKYSFLLDIKKSKELKFYGINHISMKQYLIDALSKDDFKPKWETIYFYFANNQYGKIIDREHETLIVKNIISISTYLSEKKKHSELPCLKEIYFYQCKDTYHFGGSFFKYEDGKSDVIYIVLYLPDLANFNVKENITLKIKQGKTTLYDKSERSFQYISEKKDELYKIDFINGYDYWDKSADSLYELQTKQLFYDNIKKDFFKFCSINQGDNILDLGSGTGFFSKFIIDKFKEAKITLADKSSAMLNKSMEVLIDQQNISYILRDIRCDKILYGVFESTKFSKIIIFYAFQYFVSNINDIESFALKLKKHITENGEVDIMIHNSFIMDKKNKNKENWNDPIRTTIKEYAIEQSIIVRDQTYHKFTTNEIETSFLKAGFYTVELKNKEYDRTILDRIAMWKVPAILNSLIEVKTLEEKGMNCNDFMEKVYNRIKDQNETLPTIAYFFKFKQIQVPESHNVSTSQLAIDGEYIVS